MSDIITKIGNSEIQHGIMNNRIYLMNLDADDLPGILTELDRLAFNKKYTKIFAKIPESSKCYFLDQGYQQEAIIPGFFNGKETGLFMCKFFSLDRRQTRNMEKIDESLLLVKNIKTSNDAFKIGDEYTIEKCLVSDIPYMCVVFNKLFSTYPFPIHDPLYLKKTMNENVSYFCVKNKDGEIVALSSSEIDYENKNVEMTDFATLRVYRGHSFAAKLLYSMEKEIEKSGIITSYTIARAVLPAMNITFAKLGYSYGGLLINNTNISGQIESMNVWYKTLKSNG